MIHRTVLNTRDQGVPRNRTRWYCVGIRRSCIRGSGNTSFSFLDKIPCPELDMFLEDDVKPESADNPHWWSLGQIAESKIIKVCKAIREKGGDPDKSPYVIDCDASFSRLQYGKTISPCITRSRHNGHWVANRG